MTRTLRLTLLLLALLPGASQAGDIIAHPGLNLSAADVKDVFLGEKQLADGVKLLPVDNASAQADFAGKHLQIDTARYGTIWRKKAFRDGLNPPPVKGSDAEVAAFVKANPGAVGYLAGSAPAGVKVIGKF